jgi:two-component system chemotaxis response regulator CheY
LEQLGIASIIEASDGEEAMEMLVNNMPLELILLDWNMPVMNGITFLKKLRANPAYKDIKVIMCTSESEKPRVIEAIKEGADNYIVKPFTPQTLREKLGLAIWIPE